MTCHQLAIENSHPPKPHPWCGDLISRSFCLSLSVLVLGSQPALLRAYSRLYGSEIIPSSAQETKEGQPYLQTISLALPYLLSLWSQITVSILIILMLKLFHICCRNLSCWTISLFVGTKRGLELAYWETNEWIWKGETERTKRERRDISFFFLVVVGGGEIFLRRGANCVRIEKLTRNRQSIYCLLLISGMGEESSTEWCGLSWVKRCKQCKMNLFLAVSADWEDKMSVWPDWDGQ